MKTFGQLRKEIILQRWPSGAPENLVDRNPSFPEVLSPFEQIFQEGAAEISKWVECEQDDNVNIVRFNRTHFKCGMTIVRAPRGAIHRIYTVANENYCDPVFYKREPWPAAECVSRNMIVPPVPLTSGATNLPLGFQEASSANDSLNGRARTGIWSLHEGNIYIAPWIQSNEFVVIEWAGIKEEWNDDDLVSGAQDYRKTLKLYFDFGYEDGYGSKQAAMMIHNIQKTGSFDEALADLMWQCREERRERSTPGCLNERRRLIEEILDDAVPAPAPCVNLIPDGQMYFEGVFALTGLTNGKTYRVTFGDNDSQVSDDSSTHTKSSANPVEFVIAGTILACTSVTGEGDTHITLTVCEVT